MACDIAQLDPLARGHILIRNEISFIHDISRADVKQIVSAQ